MNVTVCIATYGEQHWEQLAHRRALPSAQAQEPAEILIGHDSEGTIASARNGLAERATGDWLCFLDADDELGPGFLAAMARALGNGIEGSFLLTPAVSYVRKGRHPSPPQFNDRGIPLTDDNWLVVGTLIQTELFMQVGGFSDYPHGFEDWSLWAKAWKAGAKIVKVRHAVYLAHVNPRSLHKQAWRNRRAQAQMHRKIRAELFPELR